MAMASVTVLIVNFNAGSCLAACLRALANQGISDFTAIVVDNGSTDFSLAEGQAAVAGDARFHFDAAGRNLGFAAANNRAAVRAEGDWLVLLNPDAYPEPDWLECLLAAASVHLDCVMFGSHQVSATDAGRLDGAGDRYFAPGLAWRGGYGWPAATYLESGPVFSPCAAAAMIRADVFRAAGGFDERFFCYVEDVDLGFRLRLQGHRAWQEKSAVVRHVGGGSAGAAAGGFARYHGTRNMLWCFVKNMPGPLFWPLLPLHLMLLLLLWLRAIPRGLGGVVGRGLLDGFAGLGPVWRVRREIQAARRVDAGTIARALCWNPAAYFTRAPANRK